MKVSRFTILLVAIICVLATTIGGAVATWQYAGEVPHQSALEENISMTEFEFKPTEGVYISSATVYDYSNVTNLACEYSFPTDLYSSVRANSGGYITYKVTFHNNSSVSYWFIKQLYEKDLANNSLIGSGITVTPKDHPADKSATFNSDDWIPANTYRDVYITYSFSGSATGEKITFINYLFGVKMDSVNSSFIDALNVPESYQILTKAFDEVYAETGSVVIANIGEDKELFNQLFGGEVTINIDGNEVPVTIMIRRENVDGKPTGDAYSGNGAPTGCEYTLYITVDELNPKENTSGKATVFVVTYSEGGISNQNEWYQIGELYEGTAPLENYGDGYAFDYTKWAASPKEYIVADGITYKIGLEQGDQYQKMTKLEQIMAVQDNEIFNKINNTGILKKVYNIVYNRQNEGKPGYDLLKQAFLDAAPFYRINNNGGDIPVNTNCTRAEILPYIEAIQKALDYYNQVN